MRDAHHDVRVQYTNDEDGIHLKCRPCGWDHIVLGSPTEEWEHFFPNLRDLRRWEERHKEIAVNCPPGCTGDYPVCLLA